MRLFAGIDIGTSGCRCVLIDEGGSRIAYAERAWTYEIDETSFPRLEPERVLQTVRDVMHEAARTSDPAWVAAIGVTSQRTGVVLLDGDDEALISPNTDGRAAMEGIEQERAHGETIYEIAGRLPAMIYMPARLAWARAHLDREITGVLSLSDWLVWRMSGARATEPTQAAEMLCYDVAAGEWSGTLTQSLGVDRALLPPILASGTPAGELGDRWALRAGTPVVPAGADTQCAALAMGALADGMATVIAGTTMLAEHAMTEPTIDTAGRLWTSPTPIAGRFVHEAHCGEAGAFIAWLAGLMGTDVGGLADEAARGQPGGGGMLVVDPQAGAARDFPLLRRGTISFPAPVLAVGRPREDVARAAIEAVAFAAREGLDWLASLDGEPSEIVATGGVTRSEVFAAALAGASRRAVRVATDEACSARGAAIVAAAAQLGDVEHAAAAMHDRGREVSPAMSDGYPAHYAAWQEASAEARTKAQTMKGI